MTDVKEEKDGEIPQTVPEKKKREVALEKTSQEFRQEYEEMLGNQPLDAEEVAYLVEALFRKEKVKYTPEHFQPVMKVSIEQHSNNYQVVILSVSLGHFQAFISAFSQWSESMIHYFQSASVSEHSNIYIAPKPISETFKCFDFSSQDTPSKVFGKVLLEYFLLKISSGLGVGPRSTKCSGFDLVLYDKCIQFSMEKCLEPISPQFMPSKEDLFRLKKKLKVLHYFKIVHMDIKPLNIMFSQCNKELVFIDFGLSKITSLPQGWKVVTGFMGTLNYCSLEMKKNYLKPLDECSAVDLYHNDVFALNLSLRELQMQTIQKEAEKDDVDESSNSDSENFHTDQLRQFHLKSEDRCLQHFFKIKIKSMIFYREGGILDNQYFKNIIMSNGDQFLSFFSEYDVIYPIELQVESFIMSRRPRMYHDEQSTANSIERKKQRSYSMLNLQAHRKTSHLRNMLFQKLGIEKEELKIDLSILDQAISLNMQEDECYRLLSIEETRKLTKYQYYRLYTKIIDFRSSYSSISQKLMAAKVFLQNQKDFYEIQTNRHLGLVEASLKCILATYNCREHQFQYILPAAVINLVILEAITAEELVVFIQKIATTEGNPFKMVTLLFKLSFIGDWTKFKTVSAYQNPTMMNRIRFILIRRLRQLKETAAGVFAEMILTILLSEMNFITITNEFKGFAEAYLKNSPQFDRQIYEEVISSTIIQAAKNQILVGDSALFQLALMLQYFRHSMFSGPSKIFSFYLRLFNDYEDSKHRDLMQSMYRALITCLQDPQVISSFYFYFSSTTLQLATFSDHFKQLMDRCLEDQFKYNYVVLKHFRNILSFIKRPSGGRDLDKEQIYRQMRIIFNPAYLRLLPFPDNTHEGNLITFYGKTTYLVCIFLVIYQKDSCQNKTELPAFLNKLVTFWEGIVCLKCRKRCEYYLKSLQIEYAIYQGRVNEALEMCSTSIAWYKSAVILSEVQVGQNVHFITMTMYILFYLKSQQQRSQFWMAYDIIVEHKIASYVIFSQDSGYFIFEYISKCLLEDAKIQFFLQFQREILDVLLNHPCKEYVYFYLNCHRHFATRQGELLRTNANSIVKVYFQAFRKGVPPYVSLLLSSILFYVTDSRLKSMTILDICLQVQFVSNKARLYTVRLLFYYLFTNHVIENRRENRRKMMKFSAYLNISGSFSSYLKTLGLKNLRKKNRSSFERLMREKHKKIYCFLLK